MSSSGRGHACTLACASSWFQCSCQPPWGSSCFLRLPASLQPGSPRDLRSAVGWFVLAILRATLSWPPSWNLFMKSRRVRLEYTIADSRCAVGALRKNASRLGVFAIACFGLWSTRVCAQDTNQIEQLKKQLQSMQENFERVQREQREQIEVLTRKLEELTRQQAAEAEKKKLEQELAAQLASNQPPVSAQ